MARCVVGCFVERHWTFNPTATGRLLQRLPLSLVPRLPEANSRPCSCPKEPALASCSIAIATDTWTQAKCRQDSILPTRSRILVRFLVSQKSVATSPCHGNPHPAQNMSSSRRRFYLQAATHGAT